MRTTTTTAVIIDDYLVVGGVWIRSHTLLPGHLAETFGPGRAPLMAWPKLRVEIHKADS